MFDKKAPLIRIHALIHVFNIFYALPINNRGLSFCPTLILYRAVLVGEVAFLNPYLCGCTGVSSTPLLRLLHLSYLAST